MFVFSRTGSNVSFRRTRYRNKVSDSQIIFQDPVINVANPCIFYIGDDITQTRLIDYVTVTDADGDPFQCEIRDVKGGKDDEFLFHPNPRKGPGGT